MKRKISIILITLILLNIITGCRKEELKKENAEINNNVQEGIKEEDNHELENNKDNEGNNNKKDKTETTTNNDKGEETQNDNKKEETSSNKNKEIIKYELKTSNYVSSISKDVKYIIQSEYELNKFYSIYSRELNVDTSYLKDNSIFIQVKQLGSGSTKIKLKDVTLDNNKVNFITDINSPQTGTTDMACWYLVAIIPNQKLTNINTNEWNKSSTIANKNNNVSTE